MHFQIPECGVVKSSIDDMQTRIDFTALHRGYKPLALPSRGIPVRSNKCLLA
jgi:hypothetical protein